MKTLNQYILENTSLDSLLNTLNKESKRRLNTNDENIIKKLYNLKKISISLELRNNDNYVMLDMIESNQQGSGTKFMNDFIKWADDNDKIITLSPTDYYVGKKNLNRLVNFYKRFGFEENTGHKSHQKMIRKKP